MFSIEIYLAETTAKQADREFEAARQDIRVSGGLYERARHSNPAAGYTVKARKSWAMNVYDFTAKAFAREETWETAVAMRWGHATASSGQAADSRPTSIETRNRLSLPDFGDEKPLPPVTLELDDLSAELVGRLKRTEDAFDVAEASSRRARLATDKAFAAYAKARKALRPEQSESEREAWRQSLTLWAHALIEREAAREKALIARQLADRPTPPQDRNWDGLTFGPNLGEYEPVDDDPEDDERLF
jgi:hypothetical protein